MRYADKKTNSEHTTFETEKCSDLVYNKVNDADVLIGSLKFTKYSLTHSSTYIILLDRQIAFLKETQNHNMITSVRCPQKKVIGFRSKHADNYFQTSYERSHFYETPAAHPLYVARVKKRLPEDLQIQKPFPDNYVSVYNKEHNAKFVDYLPDYYGKPPTLINTGLKGLHEKYVKQVIKPFKSGSTTAGSTNVCARKPFEPLTLPHSSPVDDATCTIIAFGRDEFPPIPPNEPGAYKHMDPFVSTAHFAHVNFTTKQRNDLPRNDAITYYATTESQSHTKNVLPIGPYFPRCPDIDPHPVYPKKLLAVPYKGRNSTYKQDYGHAPRIPMYPQPNPQFPSVFKLSRSEVLVTPAMYCTEQGHVGGGNQSGVRLG